MYFQNNSHKYILTSTFDGYKNDLSLNVSLNEASDFGTYYCISKNPRGLVKAAMELFGEYSEKICVVVDFFFCITTNSIRKLFWGHTTLYTPETRFSEPRFSEP